MSEIKIELPIVKDAENFSFEDLKQLILQTPIKEWSESHGQSNLIYLENGEEKAELNYFAGTKGEGFIVEHRNLEDINDIVYTTEGQHTGRTAKYSFGGDVYEAFTEYFVSKETLIEAVKVFMETGGCSERLQWDELLVPELAVA
jgi:hypothetical protein